MGDIGGMKPIYVVKWKVSLKSKPSGSVIGHFQVASPLDAAFGMRKMISKVHI